MLIFDSGKMKIFTKEIYPHISCTLYKNNRGRTDKEKGASSLSLFGRTSTISKRDQGSITRVWLKLVDVNFFDNGTRALDQIICVRNFLFDKEGSRIEGVDLGLGRFFFP